jgi:hypothetical protein
LFPNQWALQERALENAIAGKRGQKFLREMERALLAMPVKRLVASTFCEKGEVCAVGAVAVQRLVDKGVAREQAMKDLEAEYLKWVENDDDYQTEAYAFTKDYVTAADILAWNLVYRNDERCYEKPEDRYAKMLKYIQGLIVREPGEAVPA